MTLHHPFLAAGLALVLALPAAAQEPDWRQSIALDGTPKHAGGFEHFDYVNPDAPKGGRVRLSEMGSFDTFNPILPQGETAGGLGLVFETLTAPTSDELSVRYPLLAEAWHYPEDFSSVTFRMDPDARWHDGEPVTPEDVVWSFERIMELSPSQQQYYANVQSAEVTGDNAVTFTFDQAGNRELPYIMGQLVVLPRHWWEGENAEGEARDIASSTLEPPMGSGPYELTAFNAGRNVTFERVEDYWGAQEPVNVGTNNFDTIAYEYFRDQAVMFEAFKADQFDWRVENRAARWATGYDIPAVERDDIVLESFENPYRGSGLMVGFVPNQRRAPFDDPRVREALNYAFDFEELNRTLFYDQYERIDSYFYGTELASEGLPEGEELEILNAVRDMVPASVFEAPYTNPTGGSDDALRENLRQALSLFQEAGYTLEGSELVDADGNQLSFEILLNGPTIEPIATHLQQNLAQIGVDVSVRSVDSPQFVNRVRDFDFDVVYTGWSQSLSPGNEQRRFWGSEAAETAASENYAGISDPAVDELIDQIIQADDRETLVAATRALDRVLLANNYVLPSYASRQYRVARWDRFSHPETLPEYAVGFPSIWWWDEDKAEAID